MPETPMAMPAQPRCACHEALACVHVDNYRPDPHGRDEQRGWNWHCFLDDCEGYSAVLVVLAEWVPQ